MVISGAAATHHSFLPWDTDDGIPQRVFPDGVPPGIFVRDAIPGYPVRTGIAVRSGPDGLWQLRARTDQTVHLRASYGRADVPLDGHALDGVLRPDGTATILEVVERGSRGVLMAHHVGAQNSGRRSLDLTEICVAQR
jgi:hypothetical protein